MIGIIQKIIARPLQFLPPKGKGLDVSATLETLTKIFLQIEGYYRIFGNFRFLDDFNLP